jgi:hypothetical protein
MAYRLLDSWCPLEYNKTVQTVVETPTYLAIAHKLFGAEERADIVGERADFERFGLHAKEWEKVAGRGLFISGATSDFRLF